MTEGQRKEIARLGREHAKSRARYENAVLLERKYNEAMEKGASRFMVDLLDFDPVIVSNFLSNHTMKRLKVANDVGIKYIEMLNRVQKEDNHGGNV